jgi:hypothetical protein
LRKELPPGTWLTFARLDRDTTDVQIQHALAECGIEVALERISINVTPNVRLASAVVSLEKTHFRDLVERALTKQNGTRQTVGRCALIPQIPANGNLKW